MTDATKIMRLDVFSHNVKATQFDGRGKTALYEFCLKNSQYGYIQVNRQTVRGIVAVYAAATKDRSEFRFHKNQYEDLMAHLRSFDITEDKIQIIHHGDYIPAVAKLEKMDKHPPYDYQVPLIDYFVSPGHTKVITLQTGKGKAVRMDTPIKVLGGWKEMRDIKEGDMITAVDGTQTKVTGVYPQGPLPMYTVRFRDGREVDACPEHLWKVYYVNTVPHRRWRIVTTLEMLRLISMPNPRVYVPLPEPEICDAVDVPLHPYLLGVILGDGSTTGGTVDICSPDDYIIEKCNSLLPEGLHLARNELDPCRNTVRRNEGTPKNAVTAALRELGVMGKLSFEKSIPKLYLNGSIEQRWELLQGLMDTDGTANTLKTGGAISYNSTSPQLAADVQYLVRSLGGMASCSIRHTQYSHNGEKRDGRESYDINIRMKTPSKIFTLPKKKERTNDDNQYAKDLKLQVSSVTFNGESYAQCISVDHHDRLFVVKDFIVTHNTRVLMESLLRIQQRMALVIRGGFVDKWISDIKGFFGDKKKKLLVVRGSAHLNGLMQMALEGSLEADFIIITNRTLGDYLKKWEAYKGALGDALIEPEVLYERLGVGVRAIDEVHMDYHLNFRQDLYTHVPKTISLSATLKSDDEFIRSRYKVMFPLNIRGADPVYDKYIAVVALGYEIPDMKGVRYKNGKNYSHTEFENSIMRNKEKLKNYLHMIDRIMNVKYLANREEGQKMLIYSSTIELCTKIAEYLAPMYPHLNIKRYVGVDEYDNLMIPDIVVTTIKSAGTGHDIEGLRYVLMTDSINSIQANIQTMGRLRKMKGPWAGITPEFLYIFCVNIDKQTQYHMDKIEKLDGMVLGHKTLMTSFKI